MKINQGKNVVWVAAGRNFLREGVVIADNEFSKRGTLIQFGINDIECTGTQNFCLKEDLVNELDGIKVGDVKYYVWNESVYEIDVIKLLKANQARFVHPDVNRLIAVSDPYFFGSPYISDIEISSVFNSRKEAEAKILDVQISDCEKKIEMYKKRLGEFMLKKQANEKI